jgi:hypothetical protein
MTPKASTLSADSAAEREVLVARVCASATFEKCYRLCTFLQYVCQCSLEGRPEAATEQQIGIHVFGRPPGYNPNEDNIVRVQARSLRLKLEHHLANEGKSEPVVITIPKGQYLPFFEPRLASGAGAPGRPELVLSTEQRRGPRLLAALALLTVLFAVTSVVLWFRLKAHTSAAASSDPHVTVAAPLPPIPISNEVRIAAGKLDGAYIDARGRRWESDRYYEGGAARPGPQVLYPPVGDSRFLKWIREGWTADTEAPPSQREFHYRVPMRPGTYELRLYFADPLRRASEGDREDGQNRRHFGVSLNGATILTEFDPVADAGLSPVDVRVFKDVSPMADGTVHLDFSGPYQKPFLSALELTPGVRGKLMPIRITARPAAMVDSEGTRWSGDDYFVLGRINESPNPEASPKVDPIYQFERYGNFSYAIPVPLGSYTVRLHFLESFFGTQADMWCRGAGCRVFDVTGNGLSLLRGFDILESSKVPFRPVIRSFSGLHPNAQGKLVISFAAIVNYPEVRAIEVLDEAK